VTLHPHDRQVRRLCTSNVGCVCSKISGYPAAKRIVDSQKSPWSVDVNRLRNDFHSNMDEFNATTGNLEKLELSHSF
jgi:hypothetical protein